MALQAALPPTDSKEFHRSELLRRLARSRSGPEGRPQGNRPRRALAWDPAEFLGVSPYMMMGICGQVGVALGLLVYATFQVAARSATTATVEPVAIQAEPAAEGPSSFLAVADLPAPVQVVDDYYFYLRQGMLDDAWALTDKGFRSDNYGEGFVAYQQSWAGAQAIEVLSMDLTWQGNDEAHLVGEIAEGQSGRRWKNTYVLRFDEATSSWTIHAITPTW
ncbi:MAG TPA: hypothetical protein VLL77_02350 [Anaerolineales bacterium]|nr:hypothetical protein [Anaerolineales bacterium]